MRSTSSSCSSTTAPNKACSSSALRIGWVAATPPSVARDAWTRRFSSDFPMSKRARIFRICLEERPVVPLDFFHLARASEGYTCAEIANLCDEAARIALETKREITEIDLQMAINDANPAGHSNNPADWDWSRFRRMLNGINFPRRITLFASFDRRSMPPAKHGRIEGSHRGNQVIGPDPHPGFPAGVHIHDQEGITAFVIRPGETAGVERPRAGAILRNRSWS